MSAMREIYIDKVIVHMGVGESGERLVKAEELVKQITGQKPVRTIAKRTQPAFGIRKGAPIGCKVTLRRRTPRSSLRPRLTSSIGTLQSLSLTRPGTSPSVSRSTPISRAWPMTLRSASTAWTSTWCLSVKVCGLHAGPPDAGNCRLTRE